jgi:hypothetical protein
MYHKQESLFHRSLCGIAKSGVRAIMCGARLLPLDQQTDIGLMIAQYKVSARSWSLSRIETSNAMEFVGIRIVDCVSNYQEDVAVYLMLAFMSWLYD